MTDSASYQVPKSCRVGITVDYRETGTKKNILRASTVPTSRAFQTIRSPFKNHAAKCFGLTEPYIFFFHVFCFKAADKNSNVLIGSYRV